MSDLEALLRELRDEVCRRHPQGRVLIGVDGRDGSGKTRFADAFAAAMSDSGRNAVRASLDDFHKPRDARYARGRLSPDGHYLDSYDYETFRRVLIDPFLEGHPFQVRAFDLEADAPYALEMSTTDADSYLIVDGLFVHRPGLRDLWHWSVWLDASAEITFARMAERDGSDPDPDTASNRRYREGWEIYLGDDDPCSKASVVIDYDNPTAPRRVLEGAS